MGAFIPGWEKSVADQRANGGLFVSAEKEG
jgi:hypothetical protein